MTGPGAPRLEIWEPATERDMTPPVRFRPHFGKDVLVWAGFTAAAAILCAVFGLRLLAVVAICAGAACVLAILWSAAIQSLTVRTGELVWRRWWGGVRRIPFGAIATIVYLPKFGTTNPGGNAHTPFLVLLDAHGHRLCKLKSTDWTRETMFATAAAIPADTKLIVTDFVESESPRRSDLRNRRRQLRGCRLSPDGH